MVPVYGLSMLVFAVGVAVAAVRRREALRPWLRAGVMLSAVVLVLLAPQLVVRLLTFEPFATFSPDDFPPGLTERMARPIRLVTAVAAVVSALLWFAWRSVALGVAELANEERPAFPWLTGRSGGEGWGGVVAVGGALAALSLGWSWATSTPLGVDAFEPASFFPGLHGASPALLASMWLLGAWADAISEELIFRGLIQRWSARWIGPSTAGLVGSVAVSTVLWTVRHAMTGDVSALGVVHLLGVGATLGVVSRWRSVEASIVVHGLLATVALAASVLAMW